MNAGNECQNLPNSFSTGMVPRDLGNRFEHPKGASLQEQAITEKNKIQEPVDSGNWHKQISKYKSINQISYTEYLYRQFDILEKINPDFLIFRPLSINIKRCLKNKKLKSLILNIETFIYMHTNYEEQNNLAFTKRFEIPIYVRPHTREFLMEISELYEIIFFTSLEVDIATDLIREAWPSDQDLPPILGRESCSLIGDMTVKELEIIRNRGKSNIVILDHLLATWYFDQDNYILIPPFDPEIKSPRSHSDGLLEVIDVLKELITSSKYQSPRFFEYCRWLTAA